MKKWLCILFLSLITQKVLAFDNPMTESYGVWEAEEEDKSIVISKHGVDKFNNIIEKCFDKQFAMQKLITISGEQLLEEIDENSSYYRSGVHQEYHDRLKLIKPLINKDQKYKAIIVFSKCDNSSAGFVFLSRKKGVYFVFGTEEVYLLMHKKRIKN